MQRVSVPHAIETEDDADGAREDRAALEQLRSFDQSHVIDEALRSAIHETSVASWTGSDVTRRSRLAQHAHA